MVDAVDECRNGQMNWNWKGETTMRYHGRLLLDGKWRLQHSSLIREVDAEVSHPGFQVDEWHRADVPTTVLNALVRAGVYPDPRYGLNNYQIPDASDEFNQEHDLARFSHLPDKRNPWKDPWWFRREFDVPRVCGQRRRLVFDAINYRADVWLNGRKIADKTEIVGGLRRFTLDVTDVLKVGGKNVLAVCIHPPDHPGMPTSQLKPFQKARGPSLLGDNVYTMKTAAIMKDVTINLAAVGYDCAPTVRDRLMGIWQSVHLEWSGPVRVVDPFVRTKLPLPAIDSAALTISAELVNDSDEYVSGRFRVVIGEITIEKEVSVPAGETIPVKLTPTDFPQLVVQNPRLWWPLGYGPQNLHELHSEFLIDDGSSSSQITTTFGIREVTKVLHEVDGESGLRVTVNGRRIFCRGGYLQVDTLLDWDMLGEDRLNAEFRYLVEAGMNTICYEDLPNPPNALLELCDRHGIMFWHCFFQCHWLIAEDRPLDHDLLESCAADIVRRYRNHPSIVVYMCMNEGAAEESQYIRWRRQVEKLDGTRILVPSGYADFDDMNKWPEWIQPDLPVGANDCKPKSYGWQDPAWYFRMVRDNRSWMFKIESGSASPPMPESLSRFLDDPATDAGNALFPLNREWAQHGANSYYQPFHEAMVRRHGQFATLDQYCWTASLQSVDQHRAMFEAVNHRLWDLTSGFLEWKLNSCWPSIQWQIYDYFLRPTASYYAIKRAAAPVSVMLCPLDQIVSVVNNTNLPLSRYRIKARIMDMNSDVRRQTDTVMDVEPDCAQEVLPLPPVDDLTPVYFVRLELFDQADQLVADNFYWLANRPLDADDTGCFVDLSRLPRVRLGVSSDVSRRGKESVVSVTVENPRNHLGFFVRLAVMKGQDGDEVLPVYWSDNYFSLLPGECKRVEAAVSTDNLCGTEPIVRVDGWNIDGVTTE